MDINAVRELYDIHGNTELLGGQSGIRATETRYIPELPDILSIPWEWLVYLLEDLSPWGGGGSKRVKDMMASVPSPLHPKLYFTLEWCRIATHSHPTPNQGVRIVFGGGTYHGVYKGGKMDGQVIVSVKIQCEYQSRGNKPSSITK